MSLDVRVREYDSLLLIKRALIPIRPQFNPRQPRRRPPHLLTDGIQRYTRIALDDQLIVNVPTDEAMAQRPHELSGCFLLKTVGKRSNTLECIASALSF